MHYNIMFSACFIFFLSILFLSLGLISKSTYCTLMSGTKLFILTGKIFMTNNNYDSSIQRDWTAMMEDINDARVT